MAATPSAAMATPVSLGAAAFCVCAAPVGWPGWPGLPVGLPVMSAKMDGQTPMLDTNADETESMVEHWDHMDCRSGVRLDQKDANDSLALVTSDPNVPETLGPAVGSHRSLPAAVLVISGWSSRYDDSLETNVGFTMGLRPRDILESTSLAASVHDSSLRRPRFRSAAGTWKVTMRCTTAATGKGGDMSRVANWLATWLARLAEAAVPTRARRTVEGCIVELSRLLVRETWCCGDTSRGLGRDVADQTLLYLLLHHQVSKRRLHSSLQSNLVSQADAFGLLMRLQGALQVVLRECSHSYYHVLTPEACMYMATDEAVSM